MRLLHRSFRLCLQHWEQGVLCTREVMPGLPAAPRNNDVPNLTQAVGESVVELIPSPLWVSPDIHHRSLSDSNACCSPHPGEHNGVTALSQTQRGETVRSSSPVCCLPMHSERPRGRDLFLAQFKEKVIANTVVATSK